ncbi:hypothetical protein J1N35_034048 [Gossypium stocksii]|uniref:Large ribosomal subunit protein eL20 domain-containing protein n=1 Tax=Gossypium stocksii TaxID=47602 RepID=A0A9D3UR86_9ROSI|nr:hypothetical protein J1N35_034048 [Gossypium stocksii]
MEEVVVVLMEAMVLIAKMEGSFSAQFHARFVSKWLLIMGIGRGLSFNVGINFIWIFEKNPTNIKNYGIWLRYQSRTGYHNMYKEYRDTTLNGAVEQMDTKMASRHKSGSHVSKLSRLQLSQPSYTREIAPSYSTTPKSSSYWCSKR